jgi:hypothetical protein
MINFGILLKKFSIPTLLLAMGIGMFYFGFKTNQSMVFNLSSSLLLVTAFLSFLYSWGGLSKKIFVFSGIAAGVFSAVLLYLSFKSVRDTEIYNSNYKKCRSLAISNLSDLRTIQMEYKKANGKYAGSVEELMNYLKTAQVDSIVMIGSKPARKLTVEERDILYNDNRPLDNDMTDEEAYRLSKSDNCPDDLKGFRRDTLKTSLLGSKFLWNKSYNESRFKAGFSKFNLDSLFFIPFTGAREKWKFEASTVPQGIDKKPVMKISGKIPFAKIQGTKNEELSVGKLDIPSETPPGSWEDE